MVTNFDDNFSLWSILFLTRTMHNWTKTITTKKQRWQKNPKKYTKDTINGNVYVEKIS